MNQAASIQNALAAVMPAVRATGLLSSFCTIQQPSTATGASGSPDGTYVDVVGLVNLACRIAPEATGPGTPSANEQRAPEQTLSEEPKHVLLDAYYPTVRAAWIGDGTTLGGGRAVIDSLPYTILGVEPDGSYKMTRMRVQSCQL